MRRYFAAATIAAMSVACGRSSPTAPTAAPAPPVVVVPPVVIPPPVVVSPPPAFPPNDARFDLAFYRDFVHNALSDAGLPQLPQPLRRQPVAPRIYLRTIDDAGAPIDTLTLDQTAAAIASVTGQLTGAFGIAGLERGTETRLGQSGWITVRWSHQPLESSPTRSVCGEAPVGGDLLTLYPRSRFCRCGGGPAVTLSIVKHEMGHALGFWHSDAREDLMYPTYNACDQQPSAREVYHAGLAYTRPIGSLAP